MERAAEFTLQSLRVASNVIRYNTGHKRHDGKRTLSVVTVEKRFPRVEYQAEINCRKATSERL